MSGEQRWVRTRGEQGVFLRGHGVIPGGEAVEVTASDAVTAAIEQKVLTEATKPKPAKAGSGSTDQEGEGS